jgi:hypothetical protein
MAEATKSLPSNRTTDHQLRLENKRIAMMTTMARYLARKAVKEHLRANGVRIWDIEAAELTKAANAYLEVRRVELMAEAEIALGL